MSYVQTVLNAVTFPAMPDMKLAISAVSPRPSMPGREIAQQQDGDREIVVAHRTPLVVADDCGCSLADLVGNQAVGRLNGICGLHDDRHGRVRRRMHRPARSGPA